MSSQGVINQTVTKPMIYALPLGVILFIVVYLLLVLSQAVDSTLLSYIGMIFYVVFLGCGILGFHKYYMRKRAEV